MKKFLLSAAALVCAASVNAQVLQLNAEELGIGSDAVDVAEGLVWGTAGSVELSNAYATQHKAVDCKNNNYNQVLFNGTDIILTKGGIQGQDNPKDIDGGNPGVTLIKPSTGAVVKLTAAADGYVYVVAKLSSNKNYYVFEEGTAIGFTLAMQVEAEGLPTVLTYEAKGEGELNEITDAGWCDWPENVYYNKVLGQEKAADIKKNGLGVIGFPVYEGCEYLVGAGGSKISWCGAYYCEAPVSVVLQGTDAENPVEDCVLLGEGSAPSQPSEPSEPEQPEVANTTSLSVTCAEAKANPWDSQVFINFPKPLEMGVKYTITMDIKGSVALEPRQGQYGPEAVQPIVQDNNSSNRDEWNGPADLQYLAHFAVTTEWVKNIKDCDGNAIVTDGAFPYSRLLLNLGLYAGTISIDNVRAIAEDGTEAFCIGFETAEEQALVENGWMNLPKEFTGIEAVKAEAATAVSYNLFGQKTTATNGLMIKSGKVVFVK